ncbi:MAG TPA: corrinoid protein [Anaerolineaceae bacterium]|jgi:5-methyltetrahydrofolate--homocysteine methyltransferase
MEPILDQLFNHVLNGENKPVVEDVRQALASGILPERILDEGMVAAMAEVGRLFEQGEYYVPEMLIAARAMQNGLAELKPHLVQGNYKPIARVALGTVKGDLHDIGKNLVSMMLQGASFEVIDLGSDVAPEKFVAAVKEHAVDIIAMSALLTTTMPFMATTIEALKTAGVREKVKIMIGGAPVTETYARQIGADGYSADASRAVTLAKALVH